jgi:V/A-type H+-transporting ATPase subunit I
MAIVKMKKLQLMAVQSQKDEILRELMLLGCVEISEPSDAPEDELIARLSPADSGELMRFRNEHASILNALRLLDRYAPVKKKLLAPKPEVQLDKLLDESGLRSDLELAARLNALDEQIRRITADESRERALIESLRPWESLEMPLECTGTTLTAAIPGTFPGSLAPTEIVAALQAFSEETEIITVCSTKEQHSVLLFCLRAEQEGLLAALRPLGFSPVNMGGMSGTALENKRSAQARLAELKSRKKTLSEEIAAESPRRAALQLRADTLGTIIARAEAASRLLCTESTFFFQGWLSAPEEKKLEAILSKYDCAWETRDPEAEEYDNVPVKLKNNKFSRPLNMVTGMYSLPAYDGIDPNPLMAPFFILYYGIMLGDMAYGAIMILAALIMKRKMRLKGGTRDFFELMFECGIASFVMGALTGSFFGDAIYQFVKMINPQPRFTGLPSLFNPLNDTVYVLIGAMVLGFIQICVGMGINVYMAKRDGHLLDAILDNGCWWLSFLGLGIGAVTGFWWVAVAGVVSIVLTQGRSKPTVFGKLVGGLAALYNVTGYLGDILSYSRLMALMLAGSVIAQVFNTLAAMPGTGWTSPLRLVIGVVAFLLIWAFGNTLNFALNLLGCYVHDLRLQCLEFFGKFYKDGGKPFRPLRVNTKYVDLVEEEN